MTQAELHNQLAPDIVARLVTPVYETGGTPADLWILTESVVLGVLLYLKTCTANDVDLKEIMDTMSERVMQRLKRIETLAGPAKGTA